MVYEELPPRPTASGFSLSNSDWWESAQAMTSAAPALAPEPGICVVVPLSTKVRPVAALTRRIASLVSSSDLALSLFAVFPLYVIGLHGFHFVFRFEVLRRKS